MSSDDRNTRALQKQPCLQDPQDADEEVDASGDKVHPDGKALTWEQVKMALPTYSRGFWRNWMEVLDPHSIGRLEGTASHHKVD
jgi:hypothetical protein